MALWSSFDVTAKGVYFAADGKLQLLDAATGKVSALAALDNNYYGSLGVSPDDHYVVWAQQDRDTTDLMLVEHFR